MERKPRLRLDVDSFMRTYWQRSPLLVREAIAGFADPLSRADVLALARSRHAISRLVQRAGSRWSLEEGPFTAARLKQLPRRDWTVLVQDTNHFSRGCARLLERFDFVPHARIDDLMVSYAVPGGGVGPHVDSYDVFLLQGRGRRRWAISRQQDHAFVPGLPLRILERFRAEEEWVLEPGDMLYLPPGVAHHGVAESECLTWSIGFRTPDTSEVVAAFLDHLRDREVAARPYRDRGMPPAHHPGAIPPALVSHVERSIARIRWTRREVRDFAGRFLGEPKAHTFFDPPQRPLARARFEARASRRGLELDGRSRLLFSGRMFYINGEPMRAAPDSVAVLRRFADRRRLAAPLAAPPSFWDAVHDWYLRGYVHLSNEERAP
jgi:50S ribosomal protein L16 3-hydroxylase